MCLCVCGAGILWLARYMRCWRTHPVKNARRRVGDPSPKRSIRHAGDKLHPRARGRSSPLHAFPPTDVEGLSRCHPMVVVVVAAGIENCNGWDDEAEMVELASAAAASRGVGCVDMDAWRDDEK